MPTEMSFVDQVLSNGVFISGRGRLQQKLGTRLTKLTEAKFLEYQASISFAPIYSGTGVFVMECYQWKA